VYAIALLVMIGIVSLLITRIATIALTVTGMTRPTARFQARSALTGVGFTTTESESVVSHPTRRRIIMALMLVGNVGLATALAGLLAGFVRAEDASQILVKVLFLVGGFGMVYAASLSRRVDRLLSRLIGRLFSRYTGLQTRDYEAMLHISGDYEVKEMLARPRSWLVDRPLGELRLRDEGMIVLGIVRSDGSYLGVPSRDTCVEAGDTVIVYGRNRDFPRLSARDASAEGDRLHDEAVRDQQEVAREEREAGDRPY
jgi:hypothetical protein